MSRRGKRTVIRYNNLSYQSLLSVTDRRSFGMASLNSKNGEYLAAALESISIYTSPLVSTVMVLSNEIRILDLWPHKGDENAPIHCSFRVARLIDEPVYEALSYVWGDLNDQLPVSISGGNTVTVTVTKNLHAALLNLRLRDDKHSLWVDQLCISQHDNDEKMAQIRLMRDIYSGCSCCIFWMGELTSDITEEEVNRSLEFLQYLVQAGSAADPDTVAAPLWLDSIVDFKGSMKSLNLLLPTKNPWWTRAWTLQEGILPHDSIFQLGPLSIAWEMFEEALETWANKMPHAFRSLHEDHPALMHTYQTFPCDLRSHLTWLDLARQKEDPLLHGLVKWRGRKATLPHDNIIALMGLWPPSTLPLTANTCDYDMPVEKVFSAFTADVITHTKGLQPLMLNPRLEDDIATLNLPRWAIDMLQDVRWSSIEWRHIFSYNWYSADNGQPLDLTLLQETWTKNFRVLGLRGIMVDEIERVEPGLTSEGPVGWRPVSKLLERLRAWADIAGVRNDNGGCHHYPGCDYTRHEAFGRLMLGDLVMEEQAQPQAWASDKDIEDAWTWTESGEHNRLVDNDLMYVPMNSCFFITRMGRIGLGHPETKPGDHVWILRGGRVPFTLRARADKTELGYDFVGWSYVQGIMRGEIFTESSDIAPEETIYVH